MEVLGKNLMWIVNAKKETLLTEGFTPLQGDIYAAAQFMLHEAVEILESEGIVVVGFKTDAIRIKTPSRPFNTYKIWEKIGKNPGEWKVEMQTGPELPGPVQSY